jgi:hypothetical protein
MVREQGWSLSSAIEYMSIFAQPDPKVLEQMRNLEKEFNSIEEAARNGTAPDFLVAAYNETAASELFYQNSYVMQQFHLKDEDLSFNIYALLGFVVAFRVLSYVALHFTTNRVR